MFPHPINPMKARPTKAPKIPRKMKVLARMAVLAGEAAAPGGMRLPEPRR